MLLPIDALHGGEVALTEQLLETVAAPLHLASEQDRLVSYRSIEG